MDGDPMIDDGRVRIRESRCSRTGSSNPSPSSGESRANPTPRLGQPASLRATRASADSGFSFLLYRWRLCRRNRLGGADAARRLGNPAIDFVAGVERDWSNISLAACTQWRAGIVFKTG